MHRSGTHVLHRVNARGRRPPRSRVALSLSVRRGAEEKRSAEREDLQCERRRNSAHRCRLLRSPKSRSRHIWRAMRGAHEGSADKNHADADCRRRSTHLQKVTREGSIAARTANRGNAELAMLNRRRQAPHARQPGTNLRAAPAAAAWPDARRPAATGVRTAHDGRRAPVRRANRPITASPSRRLPHGRAARCRPAEGGTRSEDET